MLNDGGAAQPANRPIRLNGQNDTDGGVKPSSASPRTAELGFADILIRGRLHTGFVVDLKDSEDIAFCVEEVTLPTLAGDRELRHGDDAA